MSESIIWGGVFIFSLTTLIISADFFIKASERIGIALGIPPFIIGVTLIALGTSLPELVTSIIAVLNDNPEIVSGNVVGSNIANICLVLGLIAVLARKIKLKHDIMRVDMPILMGATFLLYLAASDLKFTFYEGLLCISGLLIYLGYVFQLGKEGRQVSDSGNQRTRQRFSWKEPIILIASGFAIYLSAKYNVRSIESLSSLLGVGTEFIAVTAVAFGTSLPELVVSVVAVKTGNTEMAVGNVLGSNIFNIFGVMGIPALMGGGFPIPESIVSFSLPLMVAVTLLVFFITLDKIINRWEGLILFLFYALFMVNQIGGVI